MDHYTTMLKHVASDSVAAMFTVDGEMLQANMAPIHGRAAIRAFLAPFDGHATVDSVSTSTTSLAVYGSAAYQWGTFHQVARMDGGAPGTFNGRYAAQWAKELDGQWRVVRLLMQPAPAR